MAGSTFGLVSRAPTGYYGREMQPISSGVSAQGGYGPGGGYPPGPPGARPPGGGGKPITGSPQTMALHAMTIDPTTGLPKGEKPPASTAAVIALVSGALLCLGPLTAFPAIIAGFIAFASARKNPTAVGGGTMGILGMVLGFVNLGLTALGLLYFLVS